MSKHSTMKKAVTAIDNVAVPPIPKNTSRRTAREENPGMMLGLYRAFLVNEKKSARARAARLSFPIRAYVGPNGGGKTACMVYDALPALLSGRRILSTVRMIDPRTGLTPPNFVLFEDWDQLLEAQHTTVLMDEMVGIANSRSASSLDVRAQNKLMQLRRADVDLAWTAPNWARADKIVREVTQAVTECRGSFPARVVGNRNETPSPADGLPTIDAPAERVLWRPKRLFAWKTYDTIEFEEWTAGKREKAAPIARNWFYGPGSSVFDAYDTLDAVSIVSGMTPEGTCDICNGTVRRHACKGHTSTEQETARFERRASLGLDLAGSTV